MAVEIVEILSRGAHRCRRGGRLTWRCVEWNEPFMVRRAWFLDHNQPLAVRGSLYRIWGSSFRLGTRSLGVLSPGILLGFGLNLCRRRRL